MAGVSDYRELRVWQLSRQLADRVIAIAARPEVRRDSRFCHQAVSAAASACAAIAEGFGRYAPREFARFLKMARGSLNEVREHLHGARVAGLIGDPEHADLEALLNGAVGAATRLIRYLETARPP